MSRHNLIYQIFFLHNITFSFENILVKIDTGNRNHVKELFQCEALIDFGFWATNN